MATFHHLTLAEREELYALKTAGVSLREIGRRLHRSQSSLTRELKRNAMGQSASLHPRIYVPCKAQDKALHRSTLQHTKAAQKDPSIWNYVQEQLLCGLSPEQIAGRWRREHPGQTLHHETIYRYIYHPSRQKLFLDALLPRRQPKRRKRGTRSPRRGRLTGVTPIKERPAKIATREEVGHWETDTFAGVGSERVVVVATVERATRYVLLTKVERATAEAVGAAVAKRLSTMPVALRHSLTMDNGTENCQHRHYAPLLGMETFACTPYHAWEKGTVENTIGRLRWYLPKGQSLANLSSAQLQWLEDHCNNTPRKCLNYLTPAEKLAQWLDPG